MAILLTAALMSLVQVALLTLCGLGLARLLLPTQLHTYELPLAPLFGLALIALLGFYGANAGLSLRQFLPILLCLAVALLALATWRAGVGRRWTGTLPHRELLPLLALMLGTWLLNLAPTLNYGRLMPIGHNWDIEFYLPLASYLQDYSYPTLAQAPANPLLNTVLANPTFSRAMGASYAQALADQLGGWDSWTSWVPMLALLRALTLPGLYGLLRVGIGARPGAALAGVALAGLNSLLLWTSYNSFGMGIGGLTLLPAALLCAILALDEGGKRPIASAVFLLGGLTCTYWPMLMAYGAAGLGIGLALLIERRKSGWLAVVGRGTLLLLGGGLLSLLAHLRAPVTFLGAFASYGASTDATRFITPAVIAGTLPFSADSIFPGGAPSAGAAAEWLGWIGLGAALLLLALALQRGVTRRGLALGLALCVLAYLGGLRFVVGIPYGLLRGASYVNTLLLGLLGCGLLLQRPVGQLAASPFALRRLWHVLAASVLCASTAVASYRTYAVYRQEPGVLPISADGLRLMAERLAQPGPVAFSPGAATLLCGPPIIPWAYGLRQRELLGNLQAGYGTLANPRPGVTAAYVLLRQGEDPQSYGLAAPAVWHDDTLALYAAPPERSAWLSGRPQLYAEPPLCAKDSTNLARDSLGKSDYAAAHPAAPLTFYAGSAGLSWQPLPDGSPVRRDLELSLFSFTPQTIELELGDERRRLELPAGNSRYQAGPITLPARITLHASSDLLALRWAALSTPADPPRQPTLEPVTSALLVGLRSEPQEDGASTSLRLHNGSGQALRLAVEIYAEVAGYYAIPTHYARSLFPLPADGAHRLELDLARPALRLNGAPLPLETGEIGEGSYYAALWVYQGEQLRGVVPFLRFERRNGSIAAVTPIAVNGVVLPIGTPAQRLDVQLGDTITLEGFEVGAMQARPGDALRVSLLWQARQPLPQVYLVFVQLLDTNDGKIAQWDGAAGADWLPTSAWQPGQRIWQDVPIQIAATAPPGRYRLIAGVYDPASGQRLPLSTGGDTLLLGEVEIVR